MVGEDEGVLGARLGAYLSLSERRWCGVEVCAAASRVRFGRGGEVYGKPNPRLCGFRSRVGGWLYSILDVRPSVCVRRGRCVVEAGEVE